MIHLLIPFATCSNHVYCFTNYMMRITLVRIVTKLVRQVEVVRGKGITLIGQKVGETFWFVNIWEVSEENPLWWEVLGRRSLPFSIGPCLQFSKTFQKDTLFFSLFSVISFANLEFVVRWLTNLGLPSNLECSITYKPKQHHLVISHHSLTTL